MSRWGLTIPQFAPNDRAKRGRRRLLEEHKDSKIVNLLIGNAIGDAFGFGIEMQDAHWIRKSVVRFDTWPENPVLVKKFRTNNVRGMYSDDCEMTVGLMKGLAESGVRIDADGMLAAWRAEFELAKRRPPPAVPDAERQGHGSVKYVWRGETTLDKARAMQAGREDPGNAPPMRALPLGFVVGAAERERLCAANADSTHPHPKARAASLLIASACRYLVVEGGAAEGVLTAALAALEAASSSSLRDASTIAHLKKLDALPDYHEYGPRFISMPEAVHALLCGPQPCAATEKIPVGEPGDYEKGLRMRGLYTDAMRTAGAVLYLLKHQAGPLDALKASVDLGGDVDSVAALVLGLLGGSSGLRFGEPGGLPYALLEEVEGVEYLVAKAKLFEQWADNEAAKATIRAYLPMGLGALLVAMLCVVAAVVMGAR